jgi:hypothetical protein
MVRESGSKRPNPYNPNPPHKRVPLDLIDPSSLVPLPKPELPSDGRFTASAGGAVVGLALQSEAEQPTLVDQVSVAHTPNDERVAHGYL